MRACWEMGLSRSVVRSARRAMYSVPACLPTVSRLKNRNCRGSRRVSASLGVGATDDERHLRQAAAAAMPGAGEDQPPDQIRVLQGDLLRDPAAEGEAEQVDLVVTERPDERGGIGGHRGDRVRHLAAGSAAFIRTLGHEQVDLLGFSLGGGVAQEVTLQNPGLVRRLIVAGTGHRGGGGLTKMPLIVGGAYTKAALTRLDPRQFLFFNRDAVGKQAGTEYIARLAERTTDRDEPISQQARIAQLLAIREAGTGFGEPHDLSQITQPTFVANGDNDVMVASSQSRVLAERIPNSKLAIYRTPGTGASSSTASGSSPRSWSSSAPRTRSAPQERARETRPARKDRGDHGCRGRTGNRPGQGVARPWRQRRPARPDR